MQIQQAQITAFTRAVEQRWHISCPDYAALYQWSIAQPADFWQSVWEFTDVVADTMGHIVLQHGERMPGASWFPEARLNYAENLLRRRDDTPALIFRGEDKLQREVSYAELYHQVARLAQALRDLGVVRGDRVAAFMPNIPEAIIAMLAAASIGAVWSSCSPDFGAVGVLDRFGQIEPVVLFAVDGYYYNGNWIDTLPVVQEISSRLPSLKQLIICNYDGSATAIAGLPETACELHAFTVAGTGAVISFTQLPFAHPLFIMYSSGTTGIPKCIVHSAGGTLLQHLKEHRLHSDVRHGDRLFYFTTCGWMMWNWLASGLASGAALLLYDGAPFYPHAEVLFDYADATGMSHFGTSAKYIDALQNAGAEPARTHQLQHLRFILSTGSPLTPESFDYVYRSIKQDACLSSISGGTDIISCFALGNPALPVWRGELQCRGLGMRVEIYNEAGVPVRGEKGELVCTAPFPSMPVGFWNDPDDQKYLSAYFGRYAQVWCHGDYAELTPHDGLIIYGRSDAVLNPGGVRIGTAEIYRQVEALDEVLESIVIGQKWQGDVRIVLFVRLREGLQLDEALINRIKQQIRYNTSPRHVPARVLQVTDIPRTRSGKIVELAVRETVHNRPVQNTGALLNPEALQQFNNRPELKV
jgi:acetoacetyl-CoA synthetase